MKRAPQPVREDLENTYYEQVGDDDYDIAWMAKKIGVSYLSDLIALAPEWYENAPKMLKNIMDIIVNDKHEVRVHSPHNFFDLRPGNMGEVFNDYLNEAVEYSGYAGLLN